MKELIEEVKIINEENDIFGTYKKAKSICEFIELESNQELLSKNNLIAIYGAWGTGKSCLMKTVCNQLNKDKFDTLWFDTWKYEKDENLAYSLFKYIGKDRFWNELIKSGKNALDNIYGIFKSLSKGVELNLGILNLKPGEVLDEAELKAQQINDKIEKQKCLWEKINEFEEIFKKIKFTKNKKLVVFLDDLDRCESENIVTLISAVKLLLSINENIIFIIGIDKKAVTLALQNKYNNDYNKADEYLEKIFPINFELANNIQTQNFLKYISQITDLSEDDSKIILQFFYKIHFCNARQIKKVLRKYYLIKNYIKSKEIDIKNKCIVLMILYDIVLNIFYNDEYRFMILKEKEKIYKDILLISYDKNGFKKEARFDRYKKSCNVSYKDGQKYELYKLLIRFSSYKIDNIELNSIKTLDGNAYIEYFNWLGLFKNNICNDFIEFLLNETDILKNFIKENEFDDDKIYNYLKEIDNIL